jgi:hypothetical protein
MRGSTINAVARHDTHEIASVGPQRPIHRRPRRECKDREKCERDGTDYNDGPRILPLDWGIVRVRRE